MILDDENILVDSIQKDVDNDLNLIKIVRDQYGTFDHNETRRILNHMFSEILNDETNPQLKSLIESYGWFISDIGKYRVTISEHPKKKKYPSKLFDILVVGVPGGGLTHCVQFYFTTSDLDYCIKSYMIKKYKLVHDIGSYWVPEGLK